MKDIVKVLLEKGIEEGVIHEVLDVIVERAIVQELIAEEVDISKLRDAKPKGIVGKVVDKVKNYVRKRRAFNELKKRAPLTPFGQQINDYKSDARRKAVKLKILRNQLKQDKANGGQNANQIIQQGRGVYARGRNSIKNALNIETAIRNHLTSRGMDNKDVDKVVKSFTRKINRKVTG